MGKRGWTKDEIETAKRMYAAGDSCRSIGAAIRKHPDTVRYYIRTHIKFFPERRVRVTYRRATRRYTNEIPGTCAAVTTAGALLQTTDARGAGHASGAEADTHPREGFRTWIR